MTDKIYRGTTKQGNFRVSILFNTNTVKEIEKQHNTPALFRISFGEVITSSLLLATNLKGEGLFGVSINNNGLLASCQAEATPTGMVRGMIPENIVKSTGFIVEDKAIVGEGTFIGKRMLANDTKPQLGIVNIESNSISKTAASYLYTSEQIYSAIGLSTSLDSTHSIKASGGFLIQKLPNANDTDLFILEEMIKELPPLNEVFCKDANIDTVADLLLGRFGFNKMKDFEIKHKCFCNLDRVQSALGSSSIEELETMINEKEETKATCHFCCKEYIISKETLKGLLLKKQK